MLYPTKSCFINTNNKQACVTMQFLNHILQNMQQALNALQIQDNDFRSNDWPFTL